MRRAKAEHPHDNYLVVTAVYPDRPGTFMEIQHRPLSTGEVVASVEIPQEVDPSALRRARQNFNAAGFNVGRSAQIPFYSALAALIPDLGAHTTSLFGASE